jgi:hypothetical protein
MSRLPRVLFVSVNPFSATSNNGKTFASFFEGYPKASIAQLYFTGNCRPATSVTGTTGSPTRTSCVT